jgi:hypothetical protein
MQTFELVVMLAILINTAFLACEHYGQSEQWDLVLSTANIFFVSFFAFEAAIKIIAFGWMAYWAGGGEAMAVVDGRCALKQGPRVRRALEQVRLHCGPHLCARCVQHRLYPSASEGLRPARPQA